MDCLDLLLASADGRSKPGNAAVVAVIGSGGKSTLLRALGERTAARGRRVALATTTHFLAFEGMPLVTSGEQDDVRAALSRDGIACVGTPTGDSLSRLGAPALGIGGLARVADLVVVEADGSKRLPLKAHASHEPVVPPEATVTVDVVGASGFGRPLREAMHRFELACERLGFHPDDAATPELVARSMADEIARGLIAPTHVIVNQVEGAERIEAARRFAAALAEQGCDPPVFLGSIRTEELTRA